MPLDDNALAAKFGAISSNPPPVSSAPAPRANGGSVDDNALAAKFGAINSTPAAATEPQLGDDLSEYGQQASGPQTDSTSGTFGQDHPTVTNIGRGLGDTVSDVRHSITGIPSGIWHSLPPVQLADTMKRSLPVIDAYEKARANGASITDSIKSADQQARQQDTIGTTIKKVSDAFKANPTRETARALGDATALAVSIFAGGGAGLEGAAEGGTGAEAGLSAAPEVAGDLEGSTAAATHAYNPETASIEPVSQPGIVKQVIQGVKQAVQGGKASQAPAQSALRSTAQASADDAGVTAAADSTQGVRTLMDEPIEAIAKTERATYDAVNKAAGTDLKSLYDHAEEVQDALDDPTNIANRRSLTEDLKTTQDAITQGETKATAAGVDPQAIKDAQALTQKRFAIQNVKQKLFNNESVVQGNTAHGAPESINVDSAIRQAENLNKPSKYAPEGSPTRLVQALGEKGANGLLKGLYEAQKTGAKALSRQQLVIKLAKYGVPALATGAGTIYEMTK